MRHVRLAIKKINVSRSIANQLVGEHHTRFHRCLVGAVIMFVGVAIAKSAHDFEVMRFGHYLSYLVDLVGYAVHGIGAVPYVEAFIAAATISGDE